MKREWIPASCRIFLLLLFILLALLFFVVPSVSWADTLEDSARQLGQKVAATLAARATVVIEVGNISSRGAAELAAARRALETELQSRGIRLAVNGKPDAEVRITLSENLEGYLWVAEVQRNDAREIAMVTLPHPAMPTPSHRETALVLQKELFWEQEKPILDVALREGAGIVSPTMLVLEPHGIALYHRSGESWELRQSLPMPYRQPLPRDARGRLFPELAGPHSFRASLPGQDCSGMTHPVLTMNCSGGENSWRLRIEAGAGGDAYFTPGRNFFAQHPVVQPDGSKMLPPFFSAARVEAQRKPAWVLASVDGRSRLFVDGVESRMALPNWGSDIVAVETDCGSHGQVLATRAGDWNETDTITAHELRDGQFVAVGPAMELAGPVTALWPTASGRSAIAVARNLRTGRYEAYRILLSCSH